MKKFFLFVLVLILTQPYIVFAAPLFGANSNVGLYYFCETFGTGICTEDTNDVNTRGNISWVFVGTDNSYVGDASSQFDKVVFDIQTASDIASLLDLTVQYYNGSAWDTLITLSAEQNIFQFTGIRSISFTPPVDWAPAKPDGLESLPSAYYVRFSEGSQGAEINQISINTLGGAGNSAPEFSTLMYLMTLSIGGMYLYLKTQREQKLFV